MNNLKMKMCKCNIVHVIKVIKTVFHYYYYLIKSNSG